VTSDQHLDEATCGQIQPSQDNAKKMGEWRTASHVERQPKAKKPAIPAAPKP
jgi:hypothetical protein